MGKIDEPGDLAVTFEYLPGVGYMVYRRILTMSRRVDLCPVETTARIVPGRWKAAVLEQLFEEPKRLSELKRDIPGITQRTLSHHLCELKTAGIAERTVYPDKPPRVVYSAT